MVSPEFSEYYGKRVYLCKRKGDFDLPKVGGDAQLR